MMVSNHTILYLNSSTNVGIICHAAYLASDDLPLAVKCVVIHRTVLAKLAFRLCGTMGPAAAAQQSQQCEHAAELHLVIMPG